jgi:hypothetical protein
MDNVHTMPSGGQTSPQPWKTFEELGRKRMSAEMGVWFSEGKHGKHAKRFDYVSDDGMIVGDAKYLSLVKGTQWPPAKAMEIAGYVWLLEKSEASRRFLVFGNQHRVPEWWLEKYGHLVSNVEFYFLGNDGTLRRLC